jgi:hypothetical protein
LNATNALAQAEILPEVTIEWENFNTRTFVAVSCDDFQSNFAATIKRTALTPKRQLRRAGSLVHKFSPLNESAQIDTRGKITFRDDQGTLTQYCFDAFGHFSKGTALLKNKKLWRLISKVIQADLDE